MSGLAGKVSLSKNLIKVKKNSAFTSAQWGKTVASFNQVHPGKINIMEPQSHEGGWKMIFPLFSKGWFSGEQPLIPRVYNLWFPGVQPLIPRCTTFDSQVYNLWFPGVQPLIPRCTTFDSQVYNLWFPGVQPLIFPAFIVIPHLWLVNQSTSPPPDHVPYPRNRRPYDQGLFTIGFP